MSKLQKRLISQISPRNVSFDDDEISGALAKMGSNAKLVREYDPTDLLLRVAAGEELSGLDALLMAKTGGKIRKGIFLGEEEALGIISRVSGIETASGAVSDPDVTRVLSEQLKRARQEILSNPLDADGNPRKMIDVLKDMAKSQFSKSTDPAEIGYVELVGRMKGNTGTFRDGAYWMTDAGYKQLLAQKERQLDNLRSQYTAAGRGTLSIEQVEDLKVLQDEIDRIKSQLDEHNLGRSSNPVRAGYGRGSVKGESGIMSFDTLMEQHNAEIKRLERQKQKAQRAIDTKRDVLAKHKFGKQKTAAIQSEIARKQQIIDEAEKILGNIRIAKEEFERSMIIAPTDVIKREVGSEAARYIAADVATGKKSGVFTEAMQLLSDPLSYTEENFSARQMQAVNMARGKIESFRKGGELPKEVLDAIMKEAEEVGIVPGTKGYGKYLGMDLDNLTPEARGLAISRRKQIADVFNALQMNQDPRKIPEIVRRVTDHYTVTALREKRGQPSLVIPQTLRGRLRTFGSELASAPGIDEIDLTGGKVRKGIETIDVLTRAGTAQEKVSKATFVQFTMKGDAFVITDENAAIYKAALGTFDLDDKGLANIKTFKDAEGRTRIAFTMLRDPKSIEESILFRANLGSYETLQKYLTKDKNIVDELGKSVADSEIMKELIDSLDGDEKLARETYLKLQKILNLKGDVPRKELSKLSKLYASEAVFTDEKSLFAVENIMRIVSERTYGKLQSLNVGVDARQIDLFDTMAEQQTASTRGRANIIFDSSRGKYVTTQVAENIDAEQGSRYFRGAFVELQRGKPTAGKEVIDDFLQIVQPKLQELGVIGKTQTITAAQLQGLLKGANADVVKGIYNFGLEQLLQNSVMGSIPEISETVGALTNQMTSAFSIADQMDDLIKKADLSSIGIADNAKFLKELESKYSIGLIPASDIVDLVKQLVGQNELITYDEAIMGKSVEEAAKIRNAYEAILRAQGVESPTMANVRALKGYKLKEVVDAALNQQLRRFGYQRALAAATGTEGPGFDPLVLAERFVGEGALDRAKAEILAGYEDALSRPGINAAARAEIIRQRDALAVLSTDKDNKGRFIEALSLKKGSESYNKYAATSIQRRLAADQKTAFDLLERQMLKNAAEENIIARLDMRSQAKTMIDSIEDQVDGKKVKLKDLFEKLDRAQEMSKQQSKAAKEAVTSADELITRQQISMVLSSGIDAIRANYSGSAGDTLDIVDAVEVELGKAFGRQRVVTLMQGIGAEPEASVMPRLHELAVQRRRAKAVLADSANRQAFEQMQQKFARTYGVSDIVNIDEKTIKYIRNRRRLQEPGASLNVAEDIFDFIQRTTGKGDLIPDATVSARAAAYVAAQRVMDQFSSPGAAIDDIPPPNTAQNITDLSNRIKQESDKVDADFERFLRGELDDVDPTVARSPYKRIGQALKEGELGELVRSKGFRVGAAAVGALIVGSFAYQARKDHTSSDIQGPPLLPGGNPYETNYPTNQSRFTPLDMSGSRPTGVQYRVNTSGSMEDLDKLRSLFGGVVDGPTDTTMYNGLPRMGRDPYADVASRF